MSLFDAMLNGKCDIVKKVQFGTGQDDAYGQPAQQFVTVVAAWPCRVSSTKAGAEYKSGKEFATNKFLVFMRPPTQTDSGVPMQLDTHFWLKVTQVNGAVLASPMYLNLNGVNDPSLLGHHLECQAEVVIP